MEVPVSSTSNGALRRPSLALLGLRLWIACNTSTFDEGFGVCGGQDGIYEAKPATTGEQGLWTQQPCQFDPQTKGIKFKTSALFIRIMQLCLSAGLVSLLAFSSAAPHPNPQGSGSACSPQGITLTRAQQVTRAFTDARLVPQALPAFQPKVEVSLAYSSKCANLGTVYSTLETLTEPTISFSAESDQDPATTKYVILFIDPDAPGPTSSGGPSLLNYFLHLAVVDASPSCVNPNNLGGGRTIAMYKPLTPLSAPSHRYTQLVYRQPPGYTPPLELAYLAGGLFDLNAFVNQGGLTLVGGNYLLQGLGSIGAIGK